MNKYRVEDLGVQCCGDVWMDWRHVRDPRTGTEYALGALSCGGFALIDPKARTARQIQADPPAYFGWAICQAPDGSIYFAESPLAPSPLYRWNWQGEVARVACERDFYSTYTIDTGPDGRVYMPEYVQNVMYRYDPAQGKIESLGDFFQFGQHIRDLACAPDGLVYTTCITYASAERADNEHTVVVLDPKTNRRFLLQDHDGFKAYGRPIKDRHGKVYVNRSLMGRNIWYELVGGKPIYVDQRTVALTDRGSPLCFSDGSYIRQVEDRQVTLIDSAGREVQFDIPRQDSPLRQFSMTCGGGKIWTSSVIPLRLSSYDLHTGQRVDHGNPTPVGGEIYNMVFANGKLYMASYTEAWLTRYDPSKPWRKDQSIFANPAQLGRMKEDKLPLHRIHGRTVDPRGNVYFAARGSYGCIDSGISRINSLTDEVTSWVYPRTTFGACAHVASTDQLIVGEQRDGEKGVRVSLISPQDGTLVWSQALFAQGGEIIDWLYLDGDVVYGLHNTTATLFMFDVRKRAVVGKREELGLGHHCYNSLLLGPDQRIWGLTQQCVYAVDRQLRQVEVVASYGPPAEFHRFGMGLGPDGSVYFINGKKLMRVSAQGAAQEQKVASS